MIWKTNYISDSFPSLEENYKKTTSHLEGNEEAEEEEEDDPFKNSEEAVTEELRKLKSYSNKCCKCGI